MKICVLGDTHFGARNDSPIFDKQFKNFYENIFFPYLEQHQITTVIQLGDVFDRRKYINFNTLNSVKNYFFDRLNSEYSTYMLVGNHDTFFKNTTEVNSVDLLLSSYQNIHCIEKPQEITFDGTSIVFVPWICPENQQEVLDTIAKSKSQICCGHFEIQGFEMYKGTVIDHGLDQKLFDKFDLVMSGHYHHRSTKRNITYCGTPYELTWSDYHDPKGFHIFDTKTRELQFVCNPNVMFVKYYYDDKDKTLEDVALDDFSVYKDTIVKIIVRNKTNPYLFDIAVEKLEQAGVCDMQIVDDHFHLNNEHDEDIVNEAEDTLTILNKYIKTMQVQTNKQQLEQLMRKLYDEALSLE
jgi:DNA repair exonuclease SbcCD nuclease subunit